MLVPCDNFLRKSSWMGFHPNPLSSSKCSGALGANQRGIHQICGADGAIPVDVRGTNPQTFLNQRLPIPIHRSNSNHTIMSEFASSSVASPCVSAPKNDPFRGSSADRSCMVNVGFKVKMHSVVAIRPVDNNAVHCQCLTHSKMQSSAVLVHVLRTTCHCPHVTNSGSPSGDCGPYGVRVAIFRHEGHLQPMIRIGDSVQQSGCWPHAMRTKSIAPSWL